LTALAEDMALGRGCIGTVKYCTLFSKTNFAVGLADYVKFFNSHKQFFARELPECSIHILRNFESLAYDSVESHEHTLAFEQFLIDNSYDYRFLFDSNLMSMKQTRTGTLIVVINQQYLSDAVCKKITALVKNGAMLLITGDSAKYNEWGQKRQNWGFSQMFGVKTPPEYGIMQTDFGNGTAVYVRTFECKSMATVTGTIESADLGQMKSLKYFTHPLYDNPPTLTRPLLIKNILELLIGDIAEFVLVDPDGEIRVEKTSLPDGTMIMHIINYGAVDTVKFFFIRLKGQLTAINAGSLKTITPLGNVKATLDSLALTLKIEMQSAYCLLAFKINPINKEK
jgi:hypothetical protein